MYLYVSYKTIYSYVIRYSTKGSLVYSGCIGLDFIEVRNRGIVSFLE